MMKTKAKILPYNPPATTSAESVHSTSDNVSLSAETKGHPSPSDQVGAPSRRIGDRMLLESEVAENLDRAFNAGLAQLTLGISPASLAMAYLDWLVHLAASPGKQLQLSQKAQRKLARFWEYAARSMSNPDTPPCIEPLPQDRRFDHPAWQRWPYNLIYQGFLFNQQWWHNATTGIRGVSKHNEEAVSFVARQLLDMVSPANIPYLNPQLLQATLEEGGINLTRGWENFVDDWKRTMSGEKPAGTQAYRVGREVAISPGKVVYRNRLMELIQYTPSTDTVWREPVLMLSAWMMKYYIMDLSPHNSMVKYLVDRGHTVFMISWMNPDSKDRDLGLEDYRQRGVMAALDAISAIVPERRVHGVGYCLGGILLTIAAATMARDGDRRLASITQFTTLTDFTEVGEMGVFMDVSQATYMEDMMWKQGYLDSKQVAGSFQLLRSKDLIWSRMLNEYFLGKRQPMSDLMAWNADGTRMPYRMHSELLRKLFVNNDLVQGRYLVEGRPIAVSDIRIPIFAVSAIQDHVAPWRSVYKLHLMTDAVTLTFVLTSGGHNVGIVNEPGHPHRSYQIATSSEGEQYIDPDSWQAQTPKQDGSWWPAWQQWLAEHSTGQVSAPNMGAPEQGYAPLCDAPGTYVFQE